MNSNIDRESAEAKVGTEEAKKSSEVFHTDAIVQPSGVVIEIGYTLVALLTVYGSVVHPAVALAASGHFCWIVDQGYFAGLYIREHFVTEVRREHTVAERDVGQSN